MFFVPVQATAADKYYELYYEGTSPSYIVNYLPYSYKFSRDVYFVDATNSTFSRFYFQGSQDFVLLVDYVHTIIKHKFSRT